jgi:hypothetical protein
VVANLRGRGPKGAAAETLEVSVPAADDSPAALTRAMGAAVEQLVAGLFAEAPR